MSDETLFSMPNSPDEFGVLLPPAELRNLEFSALDYNSARRMIIEYIRTYHPNEFNDFVASNGIMMLVQIVAGVVAKLSLRQDLLAQDATLSTTKSEVAAANIIALIGQRIRRQSSASVDIEVSVEQPLPIDLEILPGTQFSVSGSDGKPIIYEIFKAPGDFVNKIVIPASKKGVIAYGLEGRFASAVRFNSTGGLDQRFVITERGVLENPITVKVSTGAVVEDWLAVFDPIEKYGPNDKVVEVAFLGDDVVLSFGNNINGAAPLAGQVIEVVYRVGGGVRGRIGVGQIDDVRPITPVSGSAPASVRFRNVSASSGGVDKESLDSVKRRAPRDYAVHNSIVSAVDYSQAALSFSHPVFGSVAKAVASVRSSRNANLVEIYVLTFGANGLSVPNAGLKSGLSAHIGYLDVMTNYVDVLDGVLKPVDINLSVVVGKNFDASVVKSKVEQAITDFFHYDNWEMGEPFYVSNLIEVVESVVGVKYIDVIEPVNNILQTGNLASAGSDGVGINELIVEGSRLVSYYYEK